MMDLLNISLESSLNFFLLFWYTILGIYFVLVMLASAVKCYGKRPDEKDGFKYGVAFHFVSLFMFGHVEHTFFKVLVIEREVQSYPFIWVIGGIPLAYLLIRAFAQMINIINENAELSFFAVLKKALPYMMRPAIFIPLSSTMMYVTRICIDYENKFLLCLDDFRMLEDSTISETLLFWLMNLLVMSFVVRVGDVLEYEKEAEKKDCSPC